jgi:hypothetical protein
MHNKIDDMTERLRVQVSSIADQTETLIENAEADVISLRKAEENCRNLTAFFHSCASLARSFENEPQKSIATTDCNSKDFDQSILNQSFKIKDETIKSKDAEIERSVKKAPEESFAEPSIKKQRKNQTFPGLWNSTN